MASDFYAAGMRATPKYFGGEENVGDAFYTPPEIWSRIMALAGNIRALNIDVEKSDIDVNWKISYADWVNEYKRWAENHASPLSNLPLTGARDQLENYEAAFRDWRAEFIKKGGKASSLVPTKVRTPPPEKKKGGLSFWSILLGGAALFGAGYVGYKFASEGFHSYKRKLGMK